MAQEAVVELVEEQSTEKVNETLVVCKSCNHLVPKTMVCLYCGAPILFKRPKPAQ